MLTTALPLAAAAPAMKNMESDRLLCVVRNCGGWLCSHAARHLRREPLPDRPLVIAAVAMATGCAAPQVVSLSTVAWWGGAATALAAWAILTRQRCPIAAAAWLASGIFAGAAGWSTARGTLFASDDLAWSLTESARPVAIEGVVVESPRRLARPAPDPFRDAEPQDAAQLPCSECVVAVRSVRDGPSWRAASGRAAVVIEHRGRAAEPDFPAGCRVRVVGRALRPSPPLNPGEFDFQDRARSLRCLSIVRVRAAGGMSVIDAPPPWSFGAIVDRARRHGAEMLRDHLGPRQAPLAAALLLGSRESLPREESLEYLVTGTIHILSISGLHVGLLSVALFRGCRLLALPRAWSSLAVAGCIGLYMLLVRAETPVVRATLLVWLGCLGAAVGRRAVAVNSLAVAAIVVLALNPQELFRTGTQLSFLSTGVLVGASAVLSSRGVDDPIERLIERSRSPWEQRLRRVGSHAWELFFTGAAVWAVTAPIVAARFHLFSPIGLILNPLIAPLVAVAMGWGFLCLIAATVSHGLASACGWACDGTLRCINAIVSWAAGLPGGFWWVAGLPGWWVAGWYIILAVALFAFPRDRLLRVGSWICLVAAWCGIGLCAGGVARVVGGGPPALRMVVAAMGHGCGIVVRSPMGRCLVYDAGRLGAVGAARRGMAAVLWTEGVSRIDTLVVSHADTDHFNAVPALFERFWVGEVVVTRAFLGNQSPAVVKLLHRARAAGIPVRVVQAGDSFPLDDCCRLRVLHPHASSSSAAIDDNETSLVLAVESAGRRLLLTGDLEGQSLKRFVASEPGACDVLIAPHHGSRTSLPADIARVTRADWVIISGPGTSGWGEVRQAYATARSDGRYATVVKTGCDGKSGGAVAVMLTAGSVRVAQFSAGSWRDVLPARACEGLLPRDDVDTAASIQAASDPATESGRVRAQPAAIRSS